MLQHVGEVPQPRPTAGVFFSWQCFGQCQRAPVGNGVLGHDAGGDHCCGLWVACIGVWPPRCLAEGSLALHSSPLPSVQGQGAAAGECRGCFAWLEGLHGYGGRGGGITALCKSLLSSQRCFQPCFLQPVDLICVYLYVFLNKFFIYSFFPIYFFFFSWHNVLFDAIYPAFDAISSCGEETALKHFRGAAEQYDSVLSLCFLLFLLLACYQW